MATVLLQVLFGIGFLWAMFAFIREVKVLKIRIKVTPSVLLVWLFLQPHFYLHRFFYSFQSYLTKSNDCSSNKISEVIELTGAFLQLQQGCLSLLLEQVKGK